jgi:hypothetical protein
MERKTHNIKVENNRKKKVKKMKTQHNQKKYQKTKTILNKVLYLLRKAN